MMVLCFVFVIVGLSLVSMTINVIQVALEDFYVNLIMKLILDYQEKMAAGNMQCQTRCNQFNQSDVTDVK